jgi:hypothetical protein
MCAGVEPGFDHEVGEKANDHIGDETSRHCPLVKGSLTFSVFCTRLDVPSLA